MAQKIYTATFALLKDWAGPDVLMDQLPGFYRIITQSFIRGHDGAGYDVSVLDNFNLCTVLSMSSPGVPKFVTWAIDNENRIPESSRGEGALGWTIHNNQGTSVDLHLAGYVLTYDVPFPIGPYVHNP